MKIFIDIGHPSHVHYFKNFIRIMRVCSHEIFITARDKEITHKLLKAYCIDFTSRGSGKAGLLGKINYLIKTDYSILKIAKRIKPDLFLSCSSPYLAQVAFIMKKPHICIDDTDISNYEHLMYVPFSDTIISPFGFKRNFGKKHIFINSTLDLFYLHPKYFKPNPKVKEELGLNSDQKTVFLRFTSMSASHDWGNKKLNYEAKLFLVDRLKKKFRIMISSENELPENLVQYKVKLSPEKIHDALFYSDLFIGESGSMSTEAAILGTPSINLAEAALEVGVFDRLSKIGIYRVITNINDAYKEAVTIINDNKYLDIFNRKREIFLNQIINPTDFLVWFIENYPKSKILLKQNKDYQYKYK